MTLGGRCGGLLTHSSYTTPRDTGGKYALELEFHKADPLTNATAYVVVNGVSPSPDGRPCLTFGCVSMAELNGELGRLEGQIREIRVSAKKSFIAAGVST